MGNHCGQEKVAGSEPCNTDPAKCIELNNGIVVINNAVDSLYLSYQGELMKGVIDYLEGLKAEAISLGQPYAGYSQDGINLVIQPFGQRQYAYLLTSDEMSIKFSNGGVGPTIYQEIRAEYLYEVGVFVAVEKARSIVDSFMIKKEKEVVSRIDLCADVIGWMPVDEDRKRFIVRAKGKKAHWFGDDLTGYEFAPNNVIKCRLYDKAWQVEQKRLEWVREIWINNGAEINDDTVIWRIEYEIHRELLHEMGLDKIHEVLDAIGMLWKYCTQWLSLRIPNQNDSTRSRWTVERWWEELGNVFSIGTTGIPLVRKKKEDARLEKVVEMFAAYLTTIAAMTGTNNFNMAVWKAKVLTANYYDNKGKDFVDIVRNKQIKMGKRN